MKKDYITRLVIVLSSSLLAIIWKPILIFIVPGILILFLPAFKKIDLITLIAYTLGISMAFWICSFWYLQFIPLSLTTFLLSVTAITALTILYCLFKNVEPYKISLDSYNFVLILLFVLVLGLRLLPMKHFITASGADMSYHSYMANLIVNANGIPDNYHPILRLDEFNTYPVGFPTISALISLLSNIPIFRSTFIMASLTYFFITLFLFVFLKRFVSWKFAFVSAISFTFFTRNPQGFSGWGGNPTIFALALFILFISFLDRIKDHTKWVILFSALSLASVLLTHTIIFVQSFYIFGVSLLIYFLSKKEYKERGWLKYLLVAILFLIITAPYLIKINPGVATPQALDWIKNWVRNAKHAWCGTVSDFIWTVPLYIKRYVFSDRHSFSFISIGAAGLVFLFAKDLKRAIQYSVFSITIVLLILNTQYWVLPFSFLIYPERAATMAVIPLSLFFAYGMETPFKYLENSKLLNRKFLSALIISLIVFTMLLLPKSNKAGYINEMLRQSSVTEADLKALYWLKRHTNETDVIRNNFGDAGLWIPAIIFRPINCIHVIEGEKLAPSLEEPKYVYIGKKCVYCDRCPLKNADFKDNDRYRLVYSQDGVYIYRILNIP